MAIGVRVGGSHGAINGATLSITATIQSGVVEGDLILIQIGTNQGEKVTSHSAPVGWDRIGTLSTTNVAGTGSQSSSTLWYREALAGDAGTTHTFSVTTTDGTTLGMDYQMLALYGHDPTDWLNTSSERISDVLGDVIRYPGITPTVDDCTIIAFAHQTGDPDVTGLVAPVDMTEEVESGAGTTMPSQRRGHVCFQHVVGGGGVALPERTSIPEGANYDTAVSLAGLLAIAPPRPPEEIRPDAILKQTNDNKTLANLQRDVA